MAGVKRSRDGTEAPRTQGVDSPYIPMFENFHAELDEHHDRREKVIKASRDITASTYLLCSGKTTIGNPHLIQGLAKSTARVHDLGERIPQAILNSKEYSQHTSTIQDRFVSVTPDLGGINAYRYQRQISPGIQEFMEAVLFQHYLETQSVLSADDAAKLIPENLLLTEDDYVLSLFDMIGELMRYAITKLATSGELPASKSEKGGANILTTLQGLRTSLEALDVSGSYGLAKDIQQKMTTTRSSVEKVEKAVYEMTVRGNERPRGWNPGLDVSREVGG